MFLPEIGIAPEDWQAIALTLRLATTTTLVLLCVGTPLAWWLAHTTKRWKIILEATVALPLVLPPTVLGFYLLVLFSPHSGLGRWWVELVGTPLPFSFTGLVLASVVYSLPFVVQPLQRTFEQAGRTWLETAWTLGASPPEAFVTIALPMAARGYLTAAILGFAHTLGEFGVVLMVGGNIPGRTHVLSIAIYDHVEALAYDQAHLLSGMLLGLSFLTLVLVYGFNHNQAVFYPGKPQMRDPGGP